MNENQTTFALEPSTDVEPVAQSRTAFRKTEKRRGFVEALTAIRHLNERWPEAFPNDPFLVKPLAHGISNKIAAETGWSNIYTQAVLVSWKIRPGYCHAVLQNEIRIYLDGSVAEGETVEADARDMAQEQLKRHAERKRQKRQMRNVIDEPKTDPKIDADSLAPKPAPVSMPSIVIVSMAKPAEAVPVPLTPAQEKERLFRAKMAELAKKKRTLRG